MIQNKNELSGVLVVDKPSGWTSFDVCAKVRNLLKCKKVGHAGTLDPMATGVLALLLNGATKKFDAMVVGEKEYLATILLGVETDTYDIEGEVIEKREPIVHGDAMMALNGVLDIFRGEIKQTPPLYSAIKKDGVPLHRLARREQASDIKIEERNVTIFKADIERVELPEFDVRFVVSKGTYIRSLAHDIGHELGCGACLKALRRTRSSGFSVDDAITMDTIKSQEFIADPSRWIRVI